MTLTEHMVSRLTGALDKQVEAESERLSGFQSGWNGAIAQLQPQLSDLRRQLEACETLLKRWPFIFFASTLFGVVFGWVLHAWLR